PLPVVHAPRRRTTQLHVPFGNLVAGFAKKLVGTRYVYGGTSPRTGFDCSGFVRYVYAHFGLALPHSSYAQYALGRRVARSALRPGDLVFFDGLGHVGMYIGNGRFIHAPHSGTRVRVAVETRAVPACERLDAAPGAGVRCVDEAAVADVHPDVAEAVEEDEVARPEGAPRHAATERVLRVARVR